MSSRAHRGSSRGGETRCASNQRPASREPLDQDQRGKHRNPDQVHHADDEEHRHQQPAAADAEEAVIQSHGEAATRALPGNPGGISQLAIPDPAVELEAVEYRNHLVSQAVKLVEADFQPVTWRAVWEYVVRDRPAAEVAGEMGITVAAVYCAKLRVLTRLRQELQGLLD